MRTSAVSLVSLLTCIVIVTSLVQAEDPQAPVPAKSLDCALYTKPYKPNEHGAFFLPAELKWKVMPRYVGRREDGTTTVDDRVTLVLQDTKKGFWPFIAKMSLEQADDLQKALAAAIAEKKLANAGEE